MTGTQTLLEKKQIRIMRDGDIRIVIPRQEYEIVHTRDKNEQGDYTEQIPHNDQSVMGYLINNHITTRKNNWQGVHKFRIAH